MGRAPNQRDVLHSQSRTEEMRAAAYAAWALAGAPCERLSAGRPAVRSAPFRAGAWLSCGGVAAADVPHPMIDERSQDQAWEAFATTDRAPVPSPLVVDVEGFEGPLDLLLALARDARRSTSPASRSWRWPSSTSPSSRRCASCGWSSPPTIWSWRRGSPTSSRVCSSPRLGRRRRADRRGACRRACAFRLQRLEAMREAAARLANRNRLGRDVFARGAAEPVVVVSRADIQATLYDLLVGLCRAAAGDGRSRSSTCARARSGR